MEGTMVSQDFRRQLEGYGLTTANILYRRPDHPWLLQSYVWQDYDLCPAFPVLNKFLNFWLETLEGPLHSVTVAHARLIKPAEIRAIDGVFRLQLRIEVGLSDVRSALGPSGTGAPSRPCHFLYPRSLNSFDLFCLSSSLS